MIAGALVGAMALVLLGWGALSTRRMLYPEPRQWAAPDPLPAYTTHALQARDGARFDVWRLPVSNPRGRLLIFHGYHANRFQVLGIAAALAARGYEALLMELRGHGSRPGPCTFGLREQEDAEVVLQWAGKAGPSSIPLGLLGLSMGAAVVCQVATQHPEAFAVVIDSPYARFYPVARRAIRRRYHLPSVPWVWVTWWTLQLVLGVRLARRDPAALACRLHQPLLAIHGGADEVVPPALTEELYARWAGPKTRWFDPATAHVQAFWRDPHAYADRVARFLDAAVQGRTPASAV